MKKRELTEAEDVKIQVESQRLWEEYPFKFMASEADFKVGAESAMADVIREAINLK